MSWTDLHGDHLPELRDAPLESRRFAIVCARIGCADGVEESVGLAAVTSALRSSTADLIVLRYPARHVRWFAALLGTGRDLLHADTLVYWRLRVGTGRRREAVPDLVVRRDPELDAEVLGGFVGAVFRDYDNHYAADPLLDPDQALSGYQEWARASATAGGTVAVETGSGELVALATTSGSAGVTEIELAGVHPSYQGRGLYAVLLAGCEDLAAAAGSGHLVISTQAHNTGVQRAWARYGFEPVATLNTLHALRAGLLAQATTRR